MSHSSSVPTTRVCTHGRTTLQRIANHTPASPDASQEPSGSPVTRPRILPLVFSNAAQTPLYAVEVVHPDGTTEIGPAGLTADAADVIVVNLERCGVTSRKRPIRWELAEKGGAA